MDNVSSNSTKNKCSADNKDCVDEAVDESFPASDPPALGGTSAPPTDRAAHERQPAPNVPEPTLILHE